MSCMILLQFVCLLFLVAPTWSVVEQQQQQQQECKATTSSQPPARVLMKGTEVLVEGPDSPFETQTWGNDNDNNLYYVLSKSKNVFYVPNFLNLTEADQLKSFCIDQGRFEHSMVRDNSAGNAEKNELIRTSESCTLVPSWTYINNPRFQAMRLDEEQSSPQVDRIIKEVDLTWDISQRAASIVNWDARFVEPLQVVRYTNPKAQYQLHHDHGDYYGLPNSEQRPWTMLVFLNTVEQGGHTYFPKLGPLRVVPRGGDALVWSNVDKNNSNRADRDMVHAGEPPTAEGIEKYAVNIWLGESKTNLAEGTHDGQHKHDGNSQ